MATIGRVDSCALASRKTESPNNSCRVLVQPVAITDRTTSLVMMAAGAVHMTVLQLFRRGLAHTDDLHVEM